MQTARSYFAEAEYAAAAKSFEEVRRIYPSDPVVLNNLAVARAANGDYQEALELLTQAQQMAAYRADIQANLANLQEWLQTSSRADRPALDSTLLSEPPALWTTVPDKAKAPIRNRNHRPACQTGPCK